MAQYGAELPPGAVLDPVPTDQVDAPSAQLPPGAVLDPPPTSPKQPTPQDIRKMELVKELGNRIGIGEFLEPLLTLGTAAVAEPLAGIAGMAGSVLPGEEGQGADWVAKTREALTYKPRTEFGQQVIEETGELLEPVGEKLTDVEKALGDFAFDMTGSPAVAAAAASAPTALFEVMGLAGLRRMRPGTVLIDDAGRPTKVLRQELNKKGLDFDALTPAVKEAIPKVVDPTLLPGGNPVRPEVTNIIARSLEAGDTSDALAGLRLDEFGNIAPDSQAAKVVKQGFTPGLVQAVKVSSDATKSKMQDMLRTMRSIKRNERVALDRRPAAVVGDSVKERITFVRDKVDQANKQLDDIVKNKLAGKEINTYEVEKTFTNALEDLGVELPDDLNLTKQSFKGSDIQTDPTAQRAIKDVLDLLKEGEGAADAARAHQVKRQLDRLIDYKKASSTKLTPIGQRILKKVRRSLNEVIREMDPEYAQLNDILSDGLEALGDFNDALGRNTDIFDPGAERGIGQELRKLMSNYGNRVVLDDSLKQLEDVARKFGGDFNDDVRALSMFANALDNRFGTVAKTSLQGVMEAAGNDRLVSLAAESLVSPKTAAARAGANVVGKVANKMRGVNEFNAFEAMDELLQRGIKQ